MAVDGDSSCLWNFAHALTALQGSRGSIRHIKGKGHWASAVHKIMARMRREQGLKAPAPGKTKVLLFYFCVQFCFLMISRSGPLLFVRDKYSGLNFLIPCFLFPHSFNQSSGIDGGIDVLILIDRNVDLITPMCTQLTYEGLLDEVLGLNYGQIRTTSTTSNTSDASTSTSTTSGQERKVSGLNSADPVFRETRDLFYVGARKWLNETLRSIQQFRDAGMNAADISELKGFVAELRDKFARIPLHTSLVDQLGGALRAQSFSARQRIEAALLNEEDVLASIENLIIGEDVGLLHVLRLLCLYCSVHGGIPKRQWDTVRRDLVNTYGHGQLITLRALSKAGMLQKKDNRKPTFPTVKAGMKLLMEEGEMVNEDNPADINFAYAGYAPLSVRIVQQALSSGGWSAADVAMTALPGPQFEVMQSIDDKGLAVEQRDKGGFTRKKEEGGGGGDLSKRRTVMVAFIGGVTRAEISALRFLSRKGIVDCDFLITTTEIVNGSSLLKSMAAGSEE